MTDPNREEANSPLGIYSRRVEELSRQAREATRQYQSSLRGFLMVCLLGVVVFYQAWSAQTLPRWSPLLAIPVAAWLFSRMGTGQNALGPIQRLQDYYGRAIARLTLDWESLDEGQEFVDATHFYATDLDLFGRGSLFQLLCSARTNAGRETLAAWMKAPATREEVLARRDAIAELRGRQDLRERLASAGKSKISDCRPDTFRRWLAEIETPFPGWAPPFAFLLALAALSLPFLYWTHALPLEILWRAAAAVAILQLALVRLFSGRVGSILQSARLPSIELPILSELLQIVEAERFSSPKLSALAARLGQGSASGSSRLRQLQRLLHLLDLRDNPMFTLVSYGLVWATQLSMAIERWRSRNGRDLLAWLQVLGEFEALISLSAYVCEHPTDVFADLAAGEPVFDAEGLGHPLLDPGKCVRNALQLGGAAQFLIVSGSNMSGKSTFLRSIGQNAVLAWMGAPVRCTRLRVSRLTIGAALRIQDSTVDGRSHFFAEMLRLRRMIETAAEGPLLFLADEILSGTNSHDRRIATEWVIRALLARRAIGAITTHDLALTEIAAGDLPGRNVHFEDTGEGGDLRFDYTLRQGILTRSNALNIAHLLGIHAP